MARFYLEPDKLLRTDYMQVMPGKFGTQLLRKCFIKGTNGLLSGWKIWLHSIELIMANCYWFWPVSCSDVAAHMIRRTSCQLKLTYFFKIIHLIGFKGLSTCCTCMLFHIAAFFQCILCRTLQSIWRPYISNAVNVANAVYMKVQLHQGDSLIHGYFPVSPIILFFFLFTLPLLFHMCHPKLVWAVQTIWFLYAVINSIELRSCYA